MVIAGIWGATLSSAFGSILGAPRILQAASLDRITPKLFAKGTGKENEPRNALLFTFLIAEAGILIGELDIIARIVSMFFITTYGFLNLSCFFESSTSPDFRPDFKVPKVASIIGSLTAFFIMIQLDFVAFIGATLILGFVFFLIKRRELKLDTGDAWNGVWNMLVKTGLDRLKKDIEHQRNWRPNLILFSGRQHVRPHLIELANWIAAKRGIISNFNLVENKDVKSINTKTVSEVSDSDHSTDYFFREIECNDMYECMEMIPKLY